MYFSNIQENLITWLIVKSKKEEDEIRNPATKSVL